jgi:hypothetical protein
MIFAYASKGSDPITLTYAEDYGLPRDHAPIDRASLQTLAVALPCVCRQIYAETATLTYSENVFCFLVGNAMLRWLSMRIPAQCEAIRSMIFYRHSSLEAERCHIIKFAKKKCTNLGMFRVSETTDYLYSKCVVRLIDPQETRYGRNLSGVYFRHVLH